MADDPDEQLLARASSMSTAGRLRPSCGGNARGSALAGQLAQAKSWIRVLGIIQRQQAAPNYRELGDEATGRPVRDTEPINREDTPMYISLAESLATGFRRWSDAYQPCGNDNEVEVARLDALAAADLGIDMR